MKNKLLLPFSNQRSCYRMFTVLRTLNHFKWGLLTFVKKEMCLNPWKSMPLKGNNYKRLSQLKLKVCVAHW